MTLWKQTTYIFVRLIGCLLTILIATTSYAVETHTKQWNALVITAPLSHDKKWGYYVEQDLRFIDDRYKYQQAILWLALSYHIQPNLTFFAGDAPNVSRSLSGKYIHQNTVWQQLNWVAYQTDLFEFSFQPRLQEIRQTHESAWWTLIRPQFLFRVPLNCWKDHTLVLFDSVFLNLYRPSWVSTDTFVSQNRIYAGIETKLSDHSSYAVGYMSQYQFSNPNQLNHIFMLTYNLNFS